MNTHCDIGSELSNILFWDVDKNDIDFDKHATFIIQRVLEYGEFCDWKVILSYYGLDKIVSECKKMRTLDPICLSFISAISHTKKEDYRCYHTAQSKSHRARYTRTVIFDYLSTNQRTCPHDSCKKKSVVFLLISKNFVFLQQNKYKIWQQ